MSILRFLLQKEVFKVKRNLKCFIALMCFIFLKMDAFPQEISTKLKQPKNLKTVTLLIDWKPNTNHLGFYVAKFKGYYEKYGIILKIINPSQTTSTALVGTGKADFGISFANDVIYARNANIPVVSIAGIIKNDTSCFVWRKSSQIKSVKDFEGKRYGGWGSPEESATLKYIMEKNGAQFSKIKMLTTGSQDFLLATIKNVDFMWAYKGWDILAAELKNVPVDTYCPFEHFPELNKPSPLLITSAKMIKDNPEVIKNFMHATSLGYEFVIKNPNEAAKIFIKEIPELDSKLVYASAKYLAPLYQEKSIKWGIQNEKSFENYTKWMQKVNLIKIAPKTSDYLNNSFLP
jgi:ABC-type nitrate/sulfonate/bicarbonate transport system substrate-binding protein